MIDFDASEIKNWADMPDAPSTFPRLIANLVLGHRSRPVTYRHPRRQLRLDAGMGRITFR